MKKKLSKILIATLIFGCMAGVAPAMAASSSSVPELSDGIVTPFAIEYETYYRTLNGVYQYRIWNATQGFWIMPWTNCEV